MGTPRQQVAGQVANNELDRIPEGTGTLLDHTTVVIGSNFGDSSNHTCNNLPTIVAGGGFDHGQHITSDPGATDSRLLGDLFVSILSQLGVESPRFSDATRGISELNGVS